MQLTFASYNIHKAVGLDRRRDPDRILAVLREVDADIIALQEVDMRLGERASVLPRAALDDTPWRAIAVNRRPRSLGWHGNALLVRRGIEVVGATAIDLPTLEPRGAVMAELSVNGQSLRVVGMHLDLSGLWRRRQVKALLHHLQALGRPMPTVMMGDLNEWSARLGCVRDFCRHYDMADTGPSFHARRPVAKLDRILVSRELKVAECGVHESLAARTASDHLPIWARVVAN